jgi:hypothetical protein
MAALDAAAVVAEMTATAGARGSAELAEALIAAERSLVLEF